MSAALCQLRAQRASEQPDGQARRRSTTTGVVPSSYPLQPPPLRRALLDAALGPGSLDTGLDCDATAGLGLDSAAPLGDWTPWPVRTWCQRVPPLSSLALQSKDTLSVSVAPPHPSSFSSSIPVAGAVDEYFSFEARSILRPAEIPRRCRLAFSSPSPPFYFPQPLFFPSHPTPLADEPAHDLRPSPAIQSPPVLSNIALDAVTILRLPRRRLPPCPRLDRAIASAPAYDAAGRDPQPVYALQPIHPARVLTGAVMLSRPRQ
ncbi:hypothetical protein TARUN_9116 [Trichoderma arundinaceum]|uniref:Uncharacterized protein n=1 Tax=Trichoderma arundinaceum TaxID=490622 RepID=A0A395NB68_TRIAR|nr:hypothetical protein TARUN_9116 [Trichoderma arundinaceum]